MGNDRNSGKGFYVTLIAFGMVVMPMSIEDKGNGLIGPFSDLRDVFTRRGKLVTGVNDEYLPVTDDDGSVAIRKSSRRRLVPDDVNVLSDLRNGALVWPSLSNGRQGAATNCNKANPADY